MDPDGRHIALGGDLDGVETLPADFNGIQDYPSLADRMISRGIPEDTVRNIYWNNALEVFKNAVPHHKG
jgi:microsomal dipeptidase-like Zn-dependent dipeptidase